MNPEKFYELELTEGQVRALFEALVAFEADDSDFPPKERHERVTARVEASSKLQILLEPQWYVARSNDHYWGRGFTRDEALEQLRKAGFRGKPKGRVTLFTLPRGALNPAIDGFGACTWQLGPKLGMEAQPTVTRL